MFKSLLLTACLLAVGMARAGEIAVIVNPAAPEFTREQIADIYLGRDRGQQPLDQPEPAALRTEFYQRLAGRDLAQMKALWSRIVFTGRGQPPREQADSAAVKRAVAANPRAIGYIEKSAVDPSVKVALILN
ncbi:type 2 periplasmic-binding domain-containing protein [Derxia lacustris]|uniref:hypothetical protein n=1 Tax=Derxia lacustris TaxID=764842 RepID=UPI000A17849E|nr:hypothetical protein [Derxia lacustris]